MKVIFTILLVSALCLQTNSCFSQSNVIVLTDSRSYYDNDDSCHDFSTIKQTICNQIQAELGKDKLPQDVFSLYSYKTPDIGSAFECNQISLLKKWNEFSINDFRTHSDISKTVYYSNAWDILKNINSELSKNYNSSTFQSTIFVVLGSLGESFFNSGQSSQIWRFVQKGNIISIGYSYTLESEEKAYADDLDNILPMPKSHDVSQPLSSYILERSLDNLFADKKEGTLTIDCERKTIPDKDELQIFNLNNNIQMPIKISGNTKIQVQSCVLTDIKGFTTGAALLHSEVPEIFSLAKNNLPKELSGLIGEGTNLPLYTMLAPYLILTASDVFDSAYAGQMIINYTIIDDAYSHAVFSDTINFKITLRAAKSISIGFHRNVTLDNENMIAYGKKKFPGKAVTQDEIAACYKSQLKKAMLIAIPIAVLIVFIFWVYIRKNKKMSWQNFRSAFRW